ncbi:MAG: hypothetical protein ACTXOO_05085 [Sodalis sp. (in: enterobacteria)]
MAGTHCLVLGHGWVIINIAFGDMNALTITLDPSLENRVDAWFLIISRQRIIPIYDGKRYFVISSLAELTSSFTTFTAVGFVHREP